MGKKTRSNLYSLPDLDFESLLARDLVAQKTLRLIFGRRQVSLYEKGGYLTRVVSSHRTALYPGAQVRELRDKIAKGKVVIDARNTDGR